MRTVAQRLGIGSTETVRTWLRRAEVDAVVRLRRANQILETASASFAQAELHRRLQ